ncbi:hypothetical protein LCGC14_2046760, partial [marine sediment metagenome]
LAPIPNNVSYETVSEQPEAEPNQPLAWPISFHGGLADFKYTPQTASASVANGVLVNEADVLRARVLQTTITLTGGANPPNYFFETTVNDGGADDGQPVLYAIANEAAEINVYKVSMDSGDFGTLLNTKTFAVTPTQPCGKPVEWNDGTNTRWYLGLGDNSFINELTTIVSSTAADTWTASGTADARHLKIVDNQLMRSTNENQVSLLAQGADPLTEANWGGDFFVGDVSALVTELGEASGLGYIAKEDGFYEWDLLGEAVNVFPEIGNAPRNGQGMKYWHGGFLIPADTGLWWTRTGKPVGPDSNPNNRANHPSLVNVTTQDSVKHGRWMSLAAFGEYIYAIYVTSAGSDLRVLWGRERTEEDPPGWGPLVWHAVGSGGADFDDFFGCTITETSEFSATETRPFLWGANGNSTWYMQLDKDGAPAGKRGDIDLATSGQIYTGELDFDLPRVTKQLHKIDGWAEDMKTGHAWKIYAFRDGGSQEQVGSDITTDGYFELFWTQDTNDTARMVLVRIDWTASDNTTNEDGPHLRDVMIRAIAVPDVTREWTFLFAVEDEQGKTAKKIRSELEAYVGDLKRFTLPDRDVFNGVMGKPRMLRADEINRLTPRNLEPPHYIISCVVREMSGS